MRGLKQLPSKRTRQAVPDEHSTHPHLYDTGATFVYKHIPTQTAHTHELIFWLPFLSPRWFITLDIELAEKE